VTCPMLLMCVRLDEHLLLGFVWPTQSIGVTLCTPPDHPYNCTGVAGYRHIPWGVSTYPRLLLRHCRHAKTTNCRMRHKA
jgi:hypothetical protein